MKLYFSATDSNFRSYKQVCVRRSAFFAGRVRGTQIRLSHMEYKTQPSPLPTAKLSMTNTNFVHFPLVYTKRHGQIDIFMEIKFLLLFPSSLLGE